MRASTKSALIAFGIIICATVIPSYSEATNSTTLIRPYAKYAKGRPSLIFTNSVSIKMTTINPLHVVPKPSSISFDPVIIPPHSYPIVVNAGYAHAVLGTNGAPLEFKKIATRKVDFKRLEPGESDVADVFMTGCTSDAWLKVSCEPSLPKGISVESFPKENKVTLRVTNNLKHDVTLKPREFTVKALMMAAPFD